MLLVQVMKTTSEFRQDTPAWVAQVWLSFLLAVGASAIGIVFVPVDPWIKAYLGMAFLFSLGSAFTLAKTIRDNHEGGKLVNRITDARAEKLLRDFDVEAVSS